MGYLVLGPEGRALVMLKSRRRLKKMQREAWRTESMANARCLDGSPAVVSILHRDPAKWIIFLQGGGWCYSLADCLHRAAYMPFGTSKGPPRIAEPCGLHQLEPFSNFSVASYRYCDGAAFGGTAGAVGPTGRFRGVPTAVRFDGSLHLSEGIQLLRERYGLATASEVMLSGCSAGGMAALLQAKAVHAAVLGPHLRRFKVFAVSGLFFGDVPPPPPLDASASDSWQPGDAFTLSPFVHQLRASVSNSKMSLPACTDQHAPWRCLLGTSPLEALGHDRDFDVFVEQSTFDRWQTGCVLGAGESPFYTVNCSRPEYESCTRYMLTQASPLGRQGCTEAHLRRFGAWQRANARALAAALVRPGDGAFIHACHTHCVEQLDEWRTKQIDGVSMIDALRAWWLGGPAEARVLKSCVPHWGTGSPAADACKNAPRCGHPRGGQPGVERHTKLLQALDTAQALRSAGWKNPLSLHPW